MLSCGTCKQFADDCGEFADEEGCITYDSPFGGRLWVPCTSKTKACEHYERDPAGAHYEGRDDG